MPANEVRYPKTGINWHKFCQVGLYEGELRTTSIQAASRRYRRIVPGPRRRGRARARAAQPLRRARSVRQRHRAVRLRQEHPLQYRRRAASADRRPGADRRRGCDGTDRARQLHVAEGPAAALAHGARQRDPRARDSRHAGEAGARKDAAAAAALRARRLRGRLSERAVGRHAAARGADAHARRRHRSHPARRTLWRA